MQVLIGEQISGEEQTEGEQNSWHETLHKTNKWLLKKYLNTKAGLKAQYLLLLFMLSN